MKILCKYDELVPVKKLKPHPKNRNKHPKDQTIRLAKMLKYQGIRAPIIVSNQSGFIDKGHGTLLAIIEAGETEAPVVYQDFIDEDQEYAFVNGDNAIASWAELSFSEINMDIPDLGPFDLDFLGIKDFHPNASDKSINEINNSDENSEWVGMPEFKPGSKYINLIFQFKTELERDAYVKTNEIDVNHKTQGQWIVYK